MPGPDPSPLTASFPLAALSALREALGPHRIVIGPGAVDKVADAAEGALDA